MLGNHQDINMVGHKKIGIYFTSALFIVLIQHIKIIFFILIIKKYILPIISSLYYMMRIFFNYYPRNSWHAWILLNILSYTTINGMCP